MLPIWILFLTISITFILYLSYSFFIKPLIAIGFYRAQGLKMTFYPVLGANKTCRDSLKITRDSYGLWKQQIKEDPKLRVIGGNCSDRAQLFLIDPKLLKEFYQNDKNYIKDPNTSYLIKLLVHGGLATVEGETWKRHRKIVSSAFRFETIQNALPTIVEIGKDFINDFKKLDVNKVDLVREFQNLAGEVIGAVFFGEKFKHQRIHGKRVITFISDLAVEMGAQARSFLYFMFGRKIFEWKVLPKHKKILNDSMEFRKFLAQIVEARKEELKKNPNKSSDSPKTFLDALLTQETVGNEEPFSTDEILDTFLTLVRTGSSTTGVSTTRIIYFMTQNPQYKERLMTEINKHFTDPSKLTFDSLNQMEFMTAFIKETMRMLPISLGIFQREAINDHNLADLKIKKGTLVNVISLLNNYNPAYHDYEDIFDPDRWLTNSKTKDTTTQDPYVYIPFSVGQKNCIGQLTAMIEMKIFTSLFLKTYNVELDPNYKHGMSTAYSYDHAERMYFRITCKSDEVSS